MTRTTPEQAATFPCPVARTFGDKPQEKCRAASCILWRWEAITTAHPKWKAAVQSQAAKTGEKAPFPNAARVVADDLEGFGMIPILGWCGLGGEPHK